MAKVSAGLLLFRRSGGGPEVLLVHPGGPYNAGRDAGIWSIPKGLIETGEDKLEAARREFEEETGIRPQGPFEPLGHVRYPSGKVVHAWAVEGDFDTDSLESNTYELEWPPRSGRIQQYPEVDRAAFFNLHSARRAILPAQAPFLEALRELLQGTRRDRS